MKQTRMNRKLIFEQLEAKTAPSSILLVVAGDNTAAVLSAEASGFPATLSPHTCRYPYDTEQILRFIAANTSESERSHRDAAIPTRAACEASDEMMKLVATDASSLLVLGFCDDGAELY